MVSLQEIYNRKSIKIMCGIILMLFIFTNVRAQTSILDTTITIKIKNEPLERVLQKIGEQVNYNFSYNPDLVSTKSEIKRDFNNVELKSILKSIINDSTLTYAELDKQIIIYKKNTIQSLNAIHTNGFVDSIITLNGQVIDAISRENLSFANIAIKGRTYGTITNENGRFKLKIPVSLIQENLTVSYIGYKNAVIPIKDLSFYNNSIFLEQDILKIQEAVIRIQDAKKLLSQAIDKFEENYYNKPYEITAFYREYVNKKSELMSITEAIIDVYKSPYEGIYSDQVKLLKSRKNLFYNADDTLAFKLKGGLNSSLYLDLIKNPQHFLMEEYFMSFSYSLKKMVMFNNEVAYVIAFKPKYYLEDNTLEGEIYLNSKDLSILLVNVRVTNDALDQMGNNLVVKRTRRTIVKPEKVQYQIAYRKIGDKYFLNMVRGELEFSVRKKRQLFSTNYTTVFEFAANKIDTVEIERFDRKEVLRTHNIFIDENYKYDSRFWGTYNYVIPNETLEDALIRIQRKLDAIKQED